MSEGSQSVDEVLFFEIFASYDASNWDIPKQRPMAPELRRGLRFSSRIVLRCSLSNFGGIITRDLMDTELKTIFPKLPEKKKTGQTATSSRQANASKVDTSQNTSSGKEVLWRRRRVRAGEGFRGREADEVTLEDPVQEDGDSKSESRVIEGFLTGGHNTKPLSCAKESECH